MSAPGEHMGGFKGTSAVTQEVNWHLLTMLWSVARLEPATLQSPSQVSTSLSTVANRARALLLFLVIMSERKECLDFLSSQEVALENTFCPSTDLST